MLQKVGSFRQAGAAYSINKLPGVSGPQFGVGGGHRGWPGGGFLNKM